MIPKVTGFTDLHASLSPPKPVSTYDSTTGKLFVTHPLGKVILVKELPHSLATAERRWSLPYTYVEQPNVARYELFADGVSFSVDGPDVSLKVHCDLLAAMPVWADLRARNKVEKVTCADLVRLVPVFAGTAPGKGEPKYLESYGLDKYIAANFDALIAAETVAARSALLRSAIMAYAGTSKPLYCTRFIILDENYWLPYVVLVRVQGYPATAPSKPSLDRLVLTSYTPVS